MSEKPFDDIDDDSGWGEAESVEGVDKVQPIDRLKPDSDRHKKVLDYLLRRIHSSEEAMEVFYPRWRANEMRIQAYISHEKAEKDLKVINDTGLPPKVISIIIPYSMAIISTIVTYHMHAFAGRNPILDVGTYKDETIEAALNMETVLQYNADHARLIRHLFFFLQDAQIYGVGIMRSAWKKSIEWRTRRQKKALLSVFGVEIGSHVTSERENVVTYEGNEVFAQDPFMFFPDPNVPMHEVNSRGEFVFWRSYEGRHTLLRAQANGDFKWVGYAGKLPTGRLRSASDSARSLISGGEPNPGSRTFRTYGRQTGSDYIQVDQGTVEIIPRKLGLGESEAPEKWMFAILNENQIVQAEPFDADHGLHPVVVIEPYSLGYGFGQPSMQDFLNPLQDTISWFVNSHIDNVRRALNDVFVVDPTAVEMSDLRNPDPGKIIRLKRSAIGRDVRQVLSQLQVIDVTKGHVDDVQQLIRIGQLLSSVSDNVLGIQQAGGRKTATEVRTAGEAGASRLAGQTQVISAQGMVDLTKIWSLNNLQYLSDDFYLRIIGKKGEKTKLITPDMLSGDFHYPIHDGTLPTDRVALLDVWREVFTGVMSDQELRGRYDIGKMFEYIAKLGGARNVESMRLEIQPDEQVDASAQAGNVVPIKGTSLGNTVEQNPGERLLEGVGE